MWASWGVRSAGLNVNGNQMSVARDGNWNDDGITPTTSYGEPSIVTVRPITPASPPNRLCQRP
jgi:hypothetical protein